MQILLASAKIMHDVLKTAPDVELSAPRFAHEAETFARDMAQYSTETIAEMPDDLRAFSYEGFKFEPLLGEADYPHFIRY